MNTRIKRAAAIASLVAAFAMSGCASIDGYPLDWGGPPPPPKLPGDSLGRLAPDAAGPMLAMPDESLRNDPILKAQWGPGDPNLAVSLWHFPLGHS